MWTAVGGQVLAHLETGDGVLSRLRQGLVDPAHDGVVGDFLSIAELLQDVQGVPERKQLSAPQALSK